jgi:predicted kinase
VEAVILVGIQGSGKTSFYRERFLDTHVRLSLDLLRTQQRLDVLLHACLAVGQPFVLDNTNVHAAGRRRVVRQALAAGYRAVCYLFEPDLPAALVRNAGRQGKARVPNVALRHALRRLERPTPEEGYEAIYSVRIGADGAFVVCSPAESRPAEGN